MADDYLAIQGSFTPAEHAFSSGSLIGKKLHNSLTADIFEALQRLKSATAIATSDLIAKLDDDLRYDAEDEISPTDD